MSEEDKTIKLEPLTPVKEPSIIKYLKEKWPKIEDWIKKHFMIAIIWLAIGATIGMSFSNTLYKERMKDAIKLGGLIINGIVYNISPRSQ